MTKLNNRRQKSAPASVDVGGATANSEAAIWARVIQPEQDTLSTDAARSFLRMVFTEDDKARMHELALKAQEGALTEGEQVEIDNFCRVGRSLDLLHSKARRALKRNPAST